MKIYAISGLGADERLFSKLELPKGYKLSYLDWPDISACDTLAEYAQLFTQKIDISEPFGLMGVSFGGMLSAELCRQVNPNFVILISSAQNSKEIPLPYKLAAKTHLIDIFPATGLKYSSAFIKVVFGSKSALLDHYIQSMDLDYVKKASQLICNWNLQENIPSSIPQLHIKGSKDLVLPHLGKSTQVIPKAGHFAVYENAEEVSALLREFLIAQRVP